MDTIDIILNRLTQNFTWIYSELGIPRLIFLTIALVVLVVLTLIARQKRKAKLQKVHKKVHTIHTESRSEIIGVKLTGRSSGHPRIEDSKKHDPAFVPETGEKQGEWGQTRKGWRKVTEQNKQLKREIARHKQTEVQHKQQLTELANVNKQLQYEITEHRQIEKSLKKQIEELTATRKQSAHEFDKRELDNENPEPGHALSTAIEKQTQQNLSIIEQTNKNIKPQYVESIAANEQSQDETIDVSQTDEIQREDTEGAEGYKRHEVPIDVKEIKAIAELAKRLRRNDRQRQSK